MPQLDDDDTWAEVILGFEACFGNLWLTFSEGTLLLVTMFEVVVERGVDSVVLTICGNKG